MAAWISGVTGNRVSGSGRLIAVFAILVAATVLSGNSAAKAAATNGEPPVEPEEISAYAHDIGVSHAAAEAAMTLQAEGSQLPLELEDILGSSFAGVWFDNQHGEFVVPIPSSHAAQTVDAGVSTDPSDFRTEPVAATWEDLEAAQRKANPELFALLPPRTVMTYLDAERNSVGVRLATTVSPSDEAKVRALLSTIGVPTTISSAGTATVGVEDLACNSVEKVCDPPVRGGTMWGYPSGSGFVTPRCTVGFPTTGNEFGNRFFLTAGHCINPKETPERDAWTETTNPLKHEQARVASYEASNYGPSEWAKFKTNGTAYDQGTSTPMIAAWGEGEEYKILSESSSYKGELVCHSGITTGVSCGPVNFLDVTVEARDFPFEEHPKIIEHETFFGPACAEHGDSGGPVYSGHTAIGITTSGPESESGKVCGKEGVYNEIIRISDETGTHIGPRVGQAPVAKVDDELRPPIVNGTEVTLRGSVDPNGVLTNFHFDYGLTSAYGRATILNAAGNSFYPGNVEQTLTGLQPNTTYHYRLVAQNSSGTGVSGDHTFTTGPGVQPPPTPVAGFSLDAGEGKTAQDLVGGHNAVIEGAEWTKGKFGDGLSFDGENDCLTISETSELEILENEEFTLEAWVKPRGEGIEALVTQEDESPAGEEAPFSYSMLVGGEEGPKGWLRKGGEEGHVGVQAPEPLPENAWSHLAFTYDGAMMRIFVDGKLAGTQPVVPLTAAKGPLRIGCLAAFGNYFKGKIDEVRIYDRALNAQQIAVDMESPLQTPPSPPVAAYAFDENEGTTAHDYAGGHDGTIEGAKWTRGRFGAALEFDGENDCVSVPESAELQFLESEEFTLEAWVKPRGEGIEALVTQEDEAGTEEEAPFSYSMLSGGEEGPKGWLRKGGEEGHEGVQAPESLPENAWSHVAFTDDGNSMHIYVDGELVGTQPAIPLTSAKGPLTIGCLAAFGNYFKGKIDEVRLYARALSASEITTDLHTGIATPQQGPIAAYSFDAGKGETLEDVTGNKHEGTIEGATWTSGKYGSALKFDGENDCVSIPNTEDLQLSEEFTLEAWVRPSKLQAFAPIFFKEIESSSFYSYSLFLGVFETGHLEGFVSKEWPEWAEVSSGEALPPKAWSHVAFTSDGAHLRLYVNGDLVDTASAGEIGESEGPLYLGCWPEQSDYFEGKIDEVRVYDRALDAGEVSEGMVASL